MTVNKTSFQPKDARAVDMSYRDDDEDDMSDLFPNERSQKMTTATQALVEFLKTSPEEFQRNTPERSGNNIFSRIRKPKRNTAPPPPPMIPSSSLSTRSVPSSSASLSGSLTSTLIPSKSYHGSDIGGHTIRRKNYIEIVPQQKMATKSAGNSRSPSFDTTSSQSFVLRSNNTNNNNTNKGSEPILPSKKRESSLYSGSLRHSTSIRSQLSTNTTNNRRPLIRDTSQKLGSKVTEEYLTLADGMDTIESALLQRLERIRLAEEELPSDQIAAGLATEHVRALGITHTLDNQQNQVNTNNKRKVRHMQVQTDDLGVHPSQKTNNTETEIVKPKSAMDTISSDPEVRAKRAEAALEEALDHFETISGLAYKKLRELWEEKMRWETACMDLRDRLLAMEQKKFRFQQQQQQQNGADHLGAINQLHCDDYFLEENEEEDELGLSEFPCSEN